MRLVTIVVACICLILEKSVGTKSDCCYVREGCAEPDESVRYQCSKNKTKLNWPQN